MTQTTLIEHLAQRRRERTARNLMFSLLTLACVVALCASCTPSDSYV